MNKNYPRVFVLWTRQHLIKNGGGRARFADGVMQSLMMFPHQTIVVRNEIEISGLLSLVSIFWKYMFAYLRRRADALQILLFSNEGEIARVCNAAKIFSPDVILVDTVRLLKIAEKLRNELPNVKIILDMDDLMSRRYEHFAEINAPINLGYMERFLPKVVARMLSWKPLLARLYRGEARGLRRAEDAIASVSDAVVFVSSREAILFRDRVAGKAFRIEVIPPFSKMVREPITPLLLPYRFITIGSDKQLQNLRTIEYLIGVWRRLSIKNQLVIFGQMYRKWPNVPNVVFAGFSNMLENVYSTNSILLTPSFVKGGVKSKVIEAFGYGTPVVGTTITFEGIAVEHSLSFSNLKDLEDFIVDIENHSNALSVAQNAGYEYVRRFANEKYFKHQWIDLFLSVVRPT
jgi:glycosyltransferase involved in cell wall biosynthesis